MRHWLALTALAAVLSSACDDGASPVAALSAAGAEAVPEAAPDAALHSEVALTTEEVEKLGVATTAVQPADFTPQVTGYGLVLTHDVIAQALAEMITAEATVRQSRAALARIKRLAGTPGGFGPDAQEIAERQLATDSAALTLAQRKLSAVVGLGPDWQTQEQRAVLNGLAEGRFKLVRVTFPLGALNGPAPQSLRLAHLGAESAAIAWWSKAVWNAPADPNLPGRSYFALLEGSDVSEGERLQAWAAAGARESGVLIPQTAIVISAGQYWCYVEERPDHFARRAITASTPLGDDYFVRDGIAVGETVVTTAAGLLLARETNPSTEAE